MLLRHGFDCDPVHTRGVAAGHHAKRSVVLVEQLGRQLANHFRLEGRWTVGDFSLAAVDAVLDFIAHGCCDSCHARFLLDRHPIGAVRQLDFEAALEMPAQYAGHRSDHMPSQGFALERLGRVLLRRGHSRSLIVLRETVASLILIRRLLALAKSVDGVDVDIMVSFSRDGTCRMHTAPRVVRMVQRSA